MDGRDWISWYNSKIALSYSMHTDCAAHPVSYIGQWEIHSWG
jgi:hypothetical protein